MNGPIAAGNVWQPVVDRAGGRCQCTGQCGRKHADKDRKPGRCEHEQGQHISRVGEIKLIAATQEMDPRYPPASGALLAWCQPCYDGRRRIARREAKAAPPQELGLFDASEYVVTPGSTKQADVGRA
ncbi:hypothetical protein [Streptomyces sp. NPDC055607]